MEQRYQNTLVSSRKDRKLAYTRDSHDLRQDKSQEAINEEYESGDKSPLSAQDVRDIWNEVFGEPEAEEKDTNGKK